LLRPQVLRRHLLRRQLRRQAAEDAAVSLGKLHKKRVWGCKKNSQGHILVWKGYKLHLAVSDIGFPLTACITGANVHDR
jgi:hypothetical protein